MTILISLILLVLVFDQKGDFSLDHALLFVEDKVQVWLIKFKSYRAYIKTVLKISKNSY